MIVTTLEIFNRAAAAADMHDTFVTPKQFGYWATQENLALALFLARSGWTQNVKTTTITVTGAEAGAFPILVSPLAIVAVHQVRNNQVRQINLNNTVDFLHQIPGGQTKGDPLEYRVIWDQDNDRLSLGFYPEPPSGTVILLSYIPEPLRLTLDTTPATGYANSVNYPMGWEEFIVLRCAKRALAKEESDTTEIQNQVRLTELQIEEACWDRVLAEHPTVRNIDGKQRGWMSKTIYPPPLQWHWV